MPSLVFIIEVEAKLSLDLVVNTRLLYLKARGIDENIELVLFALKHWPLRGDLRDAFASWCRSDGHWAG